MRVLTKNERNQIRLRQEVVVFTFDDMLDTMDALESAVEQAQREMVQAAADAIDSVYVQGQVPAVNLVPFIRNMVPRVVHLRAELKELDARIGTANTIIICAPGRLPTAAQNYVDALIASRDAKRAEIAALEEK